jgi:hypothetical protein
MGGAVRRALIIDPLPGDAGDVPAFLPLPRLDRGAGGFPPTGVVEPSWRARVPGEGKTQFCEKIKGSQGGSGGSSTEAYR